MIKDNSKKLIEAELCPPALLREQERTFARDIKTLLINRINEFVTVSCPACCNDSSILEFSKFELEFRRCLKCRTIYMSPRPTALVLADYYQNAESYKLWAQEIFPASEQSRREKIHIPWFNMITGYCEEHDISRGTLVEIGAGFGTFSQVAQDAGWFEKVIAVEPTPSLAAECRRRGLETLNLRVEELSSYSFSADVIVSFEVIEHVFAPIEFVRQIKACLNPGGLLVLSCPNGEGFDIATLGIESLAVDAEHVTLFNPSSMRLMLENEGFEIINISTPGRLDAEFVRQAALENRIDLTDTPFLNRVLMEEWEELGWPFQTFLAENGLSSHMWTVAQIPRP
tara:strand:- start:805 stop:1830 length:1026 start_codon:yes stop_codon:yes gene_type:complete